MIVCGSFGKAITTKFGNKTLWWLYILGAAGGALSMYLGMPNVPNVVPQVGADAALSAMITFYGLFQLKNTVYFFFIPVPMWVRKFIFRVYLLVSRSMPCLNLPRRMLEVCLLGCLLSNSGKCVLFDLSTPMFITYNVKTKLCPIRYPKSKKVGKKIKRTIPRSRLLLNKHFDCGADCPNNNKAEQQYYCEVGTHGDTCFPVQNIKIPKRGLEFGSGPRQL